MAVEVPSMAPVSSASHVRTMTCETYIHGKVDEMCATCSYHMPPQAAFVSMHDKVTSM